MRLKHRNRAPYSKKLSLTWLINKILSSDGCGYVIKHRIICNKNNFKSKDVTLLKQK